MRAAVQRGFAAARRRAFDDVPKLLAATRGLNPVEALRVGIGMLSDGETMPHHYLVCGAMPVFLAALLNVEKGTAPIAPDPELSTAQDLLRMIRGQRAGTLFEKALDTYLSDHRRSRLQRFDLHGPRCGLDARRPDLLGPGGAVRAEGPAAWRRPRSGARHARRDRRSPRAPKPGSTTPSPRARPLMGFGHRIYKVRDPRADVLMATVATLPATAGRLAYVAAVEQGAIAALRKHKPGRRLDTNVEYYTALLLEALEVPAQRLHRPVRGRPHCRLVRRMSSNR